MSLFAGSSIGGVFFFTCLGRLKKNLSIHKISELNNEFFFSNNKWKFIFCDKYIQISIFLLMKNWGSSQSNIL